MHWPYGWAPLAGGITGIIIFYSVLFYNKPQKRRLDYAKLFLLISFLLHYSFRVFHLQYGHLFTTFFQVAFILFLILYVRDVLFPQEVEGKSDPADTTKKSVHAGVLYLLYGIAAIGIILGAQFKILHWKFGFITGNILLTAGLLAAALSVLIGSSNSKS